jgi:hypothetical protein
MPAAGPRFHSSVALSTVDLSRSFSDDPLGALNDRESQKTEKGIRAVPQRSPGERLIASRLTLFAWPPAWLPTPSTLLPSAKRPSQPALAHGQPTSQLLMLAIS